MSQSQQLKIGDLRAVYRLLCEVRECAAEPLRWRQHLVERLGALVRARVSIGLENVPPPRIYRDCGPIGIAESGWGDDAERQHFAHYLASGGNNAPYLKPLARLGARIPFLTRNRRQIVRDRDWYGSAHVNESRRGSRVDDFIYSMVTLPIGGTHYLGFHRAWGDRPFSARAQKLVHLLHDELRRIWLEAAATGTLDPFPGLPERQRQTLNLLLRGASEKEVAQQLCISPNTVHRYVVMLHHRFRVSSRGELLASCHRLFQRHSLCPRLCMECNLPPVGSAWPNVKPAAEEESA